jgi:hypothetical protein
MIFADPFYGGDACGSLRETTKLLYLTHVEELSR